jgi:hypothetical protein
MKHYQGKIEVTTTYTIGVDAEDPKHWRSIAWSLDMNEIEAQGSPESTEITAVSALNDIEEIQREDEEDE